MDILQTRILHDVKFIKLITCHATGCMRIMYILNSLLIKDKGSYSFDFKLLLQDLNAKLYGISRTTLVHYEFFTLLSVVIG